MNYITEILPIIIISFVLIAGAVILLSNEKKSVKEWLLLAVTEAEKALGGGTGKLKLRAVFESFVKIYPVFSKFVSFDTFSMWVDAALSEMKLLIQTNRSAAEYVKGE